VNEEYNCMSYVYDGVAEFPDRKDFVRSEEFVIFHKGNQIEMKAGSDGVRLLLLGGIPLNEHIAWKGPIVMNTAEELDVAFEEFYDDKFIK